MQAELVELQGRKVKTLAQTRFSAGTHAIAVDIKDVLPGVYFVKVTSDWGEIVKKIALL